jgi:hypothetical protein
MSNLGALPGALPPFLGRLFRRFPLFPFSLVSSGFSLPRPAIQPTGLGYYFWLVMWSATPVPNAGISPPDLLPGRLLRLLPSVVYGGRVIQ